VDFQGAVLLRQARKLAPLLAQNHATRKMRVRKPTMMREAARICNSFPQKQLCDTGCVNIRTIALADGNNWPLL